MSDLFVLDRNSHIPIFSEVCTFCRHLDISAERKCAAFPGGIPLAIWQGENDHHTAFPGDHGIQFEPDPPEVVTSRSVKGHKTRGVVRTHSVPISRIRSQIWQDPEVRQQIVEIITPKIVESQDRVAALKHLPSVESVWLDAGTVIKGKPYKRRASAKSG